MNNTLEHNAYVNEICDLAKAEIEANPRLSRYDKDRILRQIEDRRNRGLIQTNS